ncbi:MAG: ribosome recycling factor [Bacteroidota bacterium]
MDDTISSILSSAEEKMNKALERLEGELTKIRAGKASPVMLSGVKVDYYGSPTPIDQVAAVSAGDATTLIVKPWEKSMIQPIERAIMEANLGLNPQNDGEMVRIPIPRLTEERRKDLVKQAKGEGENGRVALRSIRQDSNTRLKKLQKDGASEDEVKGAEKKIQDFTDQFNKSIDDILKTKEGEIMTV